MTHDVLHGDLAGAVVDNVFLLVGLPVLLAWILVRWRTERPVMTMPAIAVIAVLAITWTVVETCPGSRWSRRCSTGSRRAALIHFLFGPLQSRTENSPDCEGSFQCFPRHCRMPRACTTHSTSPTPVASP